MDDVLKRSLRSLKLERMKQQENVLKIKKNVDITRELGQILNIGSIT